MIKWAFSESKEQQEELSVADAVSELKALLAAEKEKMEQNMQELREEIAELRQMIVKLQTPEVPAPVAEVVQPTVEDSGEACYYMGAPTSDGCFDDVSPVEQPGKSLYKLSTKDGVSGSFSLIDSEETMSTAMISVSQFVKSACKVLGDTHKPPRHITTVEEGGVTREGEGWRIVRKAVVRFE